MYPYLVNITNDINNERSFKREQRDERSDGIYGDHHHDSDNHPIADTKGEWKEGE